ncbi:GAF domain-containing protein [Kineococcus radiotolerans]|uniref:GAF domain-containing protein n=1 Tax=Kineococcus radiotolerans TaxID=131568 RepID=A0A7W4TRZ4_KINRA|nr:GAF domain-containing protein [Kineococcus radiotolerans]MBB2903643.1 GAF domain-containing protein [Kineococcus radiotolerans]
MHEDLAGLGRLERLRVVRQYGTRPCPGTAARLNQLTASAAQQVGLPISTISVLTERAAVYPAFHGLSGWLRLVRTVPAEFAPCTDVVLTGEAYVIDDIERDRHHRDNPLLRRFAIASYAGVPLRVHQQIIGTVCVMGRDPHTFTDRDLRVLHDAAAEAADLLHRDGGPPRTPAQLLREEADAQRQEADRAAGDRALAQSRAIDQALLRHVMGQGAPGR